MAAGCGGYVRDEASLSLRVGHKRGAWPQPAERKPWQNIS